MRWSGCLRGAVGVLTLALLIGGETVSAEQPGVRPRGGHGPAMGQGGFHEPGVVQRDLADRVAHVGRMLSDLATILMRTDPAAAEFPKLVEAVGLGGEILRDARTVLGEGQLPREVLRRMMDQEIRMQAVMQEVSLSAGKP